MRRPYEAIDEVEPPTEAMGVLEGVTTAGGQATLSLQHLHSLLTTLAPLRTAYASAAVDRLRGLPTESRRALLPHILNEHPDLASEPRVQMLAHELGIDPSLPDVRRWLGDVSGVETSSEREALVRLERALLFLAQSSALASVEALPEAPRELVAWALEADEASLDRALHEASAAHDVPARAIDAACALGRERDEDLDAIAMRANAPRWWPRAWRDAACWAQLKKERAARPSFDVALAARLEKG